LTPPVPRPVSLQNGREEETQTGRGGEDDDPEEGPELRGVDAGQQTPSGPELQGRRRGAQGRPGAERRGRAGPEPEPHPGAARLHPQLRPDPPAGPAQQLREWTCDPPAPPSEVHAHETSKAEWLPCRGGIELHCGKCRLQSFLKRFSHLGLRFGHFGVL